MYTCTRGVPQACVFNYIKNTFMHACSSGFLCQDNDEGGAMTKYSDVMRGRYACEMIVV